ncbi:MAG: LptF/LptG family permease [Verrucomicrobiales bacterium]|nr:LptF/LptG family permease [Verrucomicrobiota bacterium JB025]
MRISDRYIGKQVLLGTLYAVLILGLVLVLGNLFKKIQPLLVEQKAPLELVLRFVISVLPASLMYTVPWGFLSAVLLVFGRLSSDHEITSFRVAGVSLVRLAAPVFVIAAGLSGFSYWLNVNVVPQSKATIIELLYEQAARNPASLLKPGVVQGDFRGSGSDGQKLLVEDRRGDWVEGFHFYQVPDEGGVGTYIHAKEAALSVDEENSQLRIKLEDAYFENRKADGTVEMAFAGRAEPLLIDLKNPRSRKLKASAMTNAQIREQLRSNDEISPGRRVKFQAKLVQRYTFSLACLAFAFVAVPLGLNSRRRETSSGLVFSLFIGTAYFLITIMAEDVSDPKLSIILLWVPNVLCVLLGIWLFRRARFK